MWPLRTDIHELQLLADGRCLSPALAGTPQAWADLAAWCRAHRGARARLWVDGSRQWAWQADPRLPLSDDQALRAAARQQLIHYHGEAAGRWPLATWSHRHGAGAVALHGLTPETLAALSLQHAVHWVVVAPAWCAAWALTAARDPAWAGAGQARLAWVEDHGVVLLDGGAGHWHRPTLVTLGASADDGLELALASAGWTRDASLRVAGMADVDWAGVGPALRGLRLPAWPLRAPGRPWQRPAAAVAAGVSAAVLGWWMGHEPAPAAAVVAATERAEPAPAAPALAAANPSAPAWTPGHWLQALDAMQRAPDGVAWLQAEIDPTEGRLQLQGVTTELARAEAAARLIGARAPWQQASLRQWQGGDPAGRFDVMATAAERLPPDGPGAPPALATKPADQARQAGQAGLMVQSLDRDGNSLHLRVQGSYAQVHAWLAGSLPQGPRLLRLRLQRATPSDDRLAVESHWAVPDGPVGSHPAASAPVGVLAAGWSAPAPPAPPPPPPAPPPAPPVATAPPFPYQVIGQLEDDRGRRVLLHGPLRGAAATQGDVLDGQWQVEQIAPTHLALRWLPQALPVTVRLQP